MANSSNGSEPNGITNQPLPASHKVYVGERVATGCARRDARDRAVERQRRSMATAIPSRFSHLSPSTTRPGLTPIRTPKPTFVKDCKRYVRIGSVRAATLRS